MSEKHTTPAGNRLLSALSTEDFQKIRAASDLTELSLGKIIYEPNELIRHVYFPDSGIISLLSTTDDRSMLEVGVVGSEGMAGLPVFLGAERSGNQAIVQGDGVALKIKTAVFLKECARSERLFQLLQRYTHSLLTQVSQAAVCNRFHQVDARLARWLLMTHDRLETDELQLTQEFLSNMLGVRREAVTIAARSLQQQKLITYTRGHLQVLDRAALEAVSCECYAIIKNEEMSIFKSEKV